MDPTEEVETQPRDTHAQWLILVLIVACTILLFILHALTDPLIKFISNAANCVIDTSAWNIFSYVTLWLKAIFFFLGWIALSVTTVAILYKIFFSETEEGQEEGQWKWWAGTGAALLLASNRKSSSKGDLSAAASGAIAGTATYGLWVFIKNLPKAFALLFIILSPFYFFAMGVNGLYCGKFQTNAHNFDVKRVQNYIEINSRCRKEIRDGHGHFESTIRICEERDALHLSLIDDGYCESKGNWTNCKIKTNEDTNTQESNAPAVENLPTAVNKKIQLFKEKDSLCREGRRDGHGDLETTIRTCEERDALLYSLIDDGYCLSEGNWSKCKNKNNEDTNTQESNKDSNGQQPTLPPKNILDLRPVITSEQNIAINESISEQVSILNTHADKSLADALNIYRDLVSNFEKEKQYDGDDMIVRCNNDIPRKQLKDSAEVELWERLLKEAGGIGSSAIKKMVEEQCSKVY